jgi:pimeloyl-ACP methyl ester carboxylesterase
MSVRTIRAGVLDVAYEEHGPAEGVPVVLLHGFPYDPRAFDGSAALLAERGARVLVPYLRGYGPTRFVSDATPRSGQQAAVGADLLAFLDALEVERAVLAGFDWGGRAACIVSALWPERVHGLVTVNGYAIQDIAAAAEPAPPEVEHQLWYQFYLHGDRGVRGLRANRRELARLLWRLWSPTWDVDDATFAETAASFDNPDFVDVVVHSYRHRFGLVSGDPALQDIEDRLAQRPRITVPTVTLDPLDDGVVAGSARDRAHLFTDLREHVDVPGAGHDLPQEAPGAFAAAVASLLPR